jgi:DNA processing protein
MALLARSNISVLTRVGESYPRLLAEISAPPPVLYVKGTLLPEDAIAVGVVGTRRCTSYGRAVAKQLVGELAEAGVTIISGLALGIDGCAHQAALDASGRTIAVLGCGVNVVYPWQHRNLAAQIVEHGALVSDYPPDTKPEGTNFPARNRIISGLSLGVLVIEAPAKSGARQYISDPAPFHGRRRDAAGGGLGADRQSR